MLELTNENSVAKIAYNVGECVFFPFYRTSVSIQCEVATASNRFHGLWMELQTIIATSYPIEQGQNNSSTCYV
jgi:hypothetical protein